MVQVFDVQISPARLIFMVTNLCCCRSLVYTIPPTLRTTVSVTTVRPSCPLQTYVPESECRTSLMMSTPRRSSWARPGGSGAPSLPQRSRTWRPTSDWPLQRNRTVEPISAIWIRGSVTVRTIDGALGPCCCGGCWITGGCWIPPPPVVNNGTN